MPRLNLVDTLRAATHEALLVSLRQQMPPGPLRDYYQRGMDPSWPDHSRFLQAAGVAQLTRLYAVLVDGLVDGTGSKIAELLAPIAVYQTYEIISDNLCTGLYRPPPEAPVIDLGGRAPGRPGSGDDTAPSRRQLLHAFTGAMTARLRGDSRTAALALAPERHRASRVPALQHGLSSRTHRELTAHGADRPSAAELNRDLWPALVANIEAAVGVAGSTAGTPLGRVVRDGLIDRYRAVDRTLSDRHLCRTELSAVGTHSVLVVPTLGYCVAVLDEVAGPSPGLAATVTDGTLPEALFDAALLSRLLNDVGTALLRMSGPARRRELVRLQARAAHDGLAAALGTPLFTRLAKDVSYGEFNVCLYGARRAADPAAAMSTLEADLDYFALLYRLHRRRLRDTLRTLTARLDDPRPAAVIKRFLRFHVELYSHPHQEAAGEYAS